jgi:hypothetical protein
MIRRSLPSVARIDPRQRTAFTLVEATVALAITGMAASALLLSLASATTTTDDAVRKYIGWGIGQTLMDEISGMRYMERGANPLDTSMTAGADEQSATGRTIYDDIDDFNGLRYQPPLDRNGQTLGNENGDTIARDPRFRVPAAVMARWKVESDVFYVNENAWLTALPVTTPKNYRTARVRVYYVPVSGSSVLMSETTRTFSYVPEP